MNLNIMILPPLEKEINLLDIMAQIPMETGIHEWLQPAIVLQFFHNMIQNNIVLLFTALIISSICYWIGNIYNRTLNLTDKPGVMKTIHIQGQSALQKYVFIGVFFLIITIYQLILMDGVFQPIQWIPPIALTLLAMFFIIDTLFQVNTTDIETPDQHHFFSLPRAHGPGFVNSCKALISLCALYWFSLKLPAADSVTLQVLLQSSVIFFGSIAALIFIRKASHICNLADKRRPFIWLLQIILLGSFLGDVSGYRYFAHWVFFGAIGTLGCIGLFLIFKSIIARQILALSSPDHPWHAKLRKFIKIEVEDAQSNLPWIMAFINVVLGMFTLIGILAAWGLSNSSFVWLHQFAVHGFSIGESKIVPLKILFGVFIFVMILKVGQSLARRATRGTLLKRKLDNSSIETLSKLTTYIAFMAAALVGLTIAGFNFQNFAIIAGALSVGIGFGLQNIVNNFVSGIILLFERPVRTGDWVSVGGTEGIVKNIRVRSTEIQTWDRTDVIIPNSEFISSQVNNYTLRDPYGRIVLPIGVAYGSDTQLVKSILEKVSAAHPAVLKDLPYSNIPNPNVIFNGFGDSSLNFELRCFIRDIKDRKQIMSDLFFEIDRLFREHNVEIPFPQRDLHIRSSVLIPTANDQQYQPPPN